MKKKVKATIGVFAGIINPSGKILLRRRLEESSITGESFKGCWELPGGGVLLQDGMPYDHLVRELEREVKEEVGIQIELQFMSPMYPVFFGEAQDLALVAPFVTDQKPTTKGETRWVSLEQLNDLAKAYTPPDKETGKEGRGIVSGYGKRMHCMALKALSVSGPDSFVSGRILGGPSPKEAADALTVLWEIQAMW